MNASSLLLILIIALIVIKPERLPECCHFLGLCLRRLMALYQGLLGKYQDFL